MGTTILIIIAAACLVSMYISMHREVSFYEKQYHKYENLYHEMDEVANEYHKLATDAIEHASETLDSNTKLIKNLENLDFLIKLFLDGIDDEVADVMNEHIKDRGLLIKFYEGKWKLFIKRDE